MADETGRSAEELATLAAENPVEWLNALLEKLELSTTEVDQLRWKDNGEPQLGDLELIEVSSEGGSEGDGEHVEIVFAIAPIGNEEKDGRVQGAIAYLRLTGYYESYSGTEWDGEVQVVEPRDVMVVKYFEKNPSEA